MRRYDCKAMKARSHYDPRSRARAKQASRAADERTLASRAKTVALLKRENEVFAPLARSARVDLTASRSLG
jgi:hypothetical protein